MGSHVAVVVSLFILGSISCSILATEYSTQQARQKRGGRPRGRMLSGAGGGRKNIKFRSRHRRGTEFGLTNHIIGFSSSSLKEWIDRANMSKEIISTGYAQIWNNLIPQSDPRGYRQKEFHGRFPYGNTKNGNEMRVRNYQFDRSYNATISYKMNSKSEHPTYSVLSNDGI